MRMGCFPISLPIPAPACMLEPSKDPVFHLYLFCSLSSVNPLCGLMHCLVCS
uniref:Squamosa promoter-binding-like protein 3 n=1 Tax=Rhizophora mucronata TaxID=61149 RepID=A0A2P2PQC0_RHIMU